MYFLKHFFFQISVGLSCTFKESRYTVVYLNSFQSKWKNRKTPCEWDGPVTLTRALSEVMPDSGSLQMPIWSQRLLAIISSQHVHIKGKSTEGFLIPRIAFFLHRFFSEKYLRRLQEVQNWLRKTASNFTVKGLWSRGDNSFRIFSEHENCLLTDCEMRRLLRNLDFREHRPEDFWIHYFFWSCHKI